MSVSRDLALAQVRLLAKLDYFPADDEGFIHGLVDALVGSRTEAVAMAVVKEWLRESHERPTPAHLYRAVERHNRLAANKVVGRSRHVSFEDWNIAFGTDFDAFLEWVVSMKKWPIASA